MWTCKLCEVQFWQESIERHLTSNHITLITPVDRKVGRQHLNVYDCGACSFSGDSFDDVAQHCMAVLHEPVCVGLGKDFDNYYSRQLFGALQTVMGLSPNDDQLLKQFTSDDQSNRPPSTASPVVDFQRSSSDKQTYRPGSPATNGRSTRQIRVFRIRNRQFTNHQSTTSESMTVQTRSNTGEESPFNDGDSENIYALKFRPATNNESNVGTPEAAVRTDNEPLGGNDTFTANLDPEDSEEDTEDGSDPQAKSQLLSKSMATGNPNRWSMKQALNFSVGSPMSILGGHMPIGPPRTTDAFVRKRGPYKKRKSSYIRNLPPSDSNVQTSPSHPCHLCTEMFYTIHHLNAHFSAVHGLPESNEKLSNSDVMEPQFDVSTGRRLYPCSYCGKRFLNRYYISIHERIHTGVTAYACTDCGKTFPQKSNYVAHRRIHSGERPYPCEDCDARFVNSSHLNAHRRKHTGERPYHCPLCGDRFTRGTSLKRHQETFHQQQMNANEHESVEMNPMKHRRRRNVGQTHLRPLLTTMNIKSETGGNDETEIVTTDAEERDKSVEPERDQEDEGEEQQLNGNKHEIQQLHGYEDEEQQLNRYEDSAENPPVGSDDTDGVEGNISHPDEICNGE